MKPLEIQQTDETPNIFFDKEKGIFQILGVALPENAIKFCEPVMRWINEYISSPNIETKFDFKLEYFNTSFSSQIIKILLMLEELNKTNKVVINWHYKDIDEDMLELGMKFSEIININFNLIKYH